MKRVYVVDDDKDIVESISIVLESAGYEVGAQHDDKDVVANVAGFGADLVILDVMFPEDSSAGFEIARRLKADDTLQKIPILMLSAINERGIYVGKFSNKDRDESFLPVNLFLEKPLRPNMLIERVSSLIGK